MLRPRRTPARSPRRMSTALRACVLCALSLLPIGLAAPAHAAAASTVQNAAEVAVARGYRTGVAVLDLATGRYSGGGDDTGVFPSESVVKVLIATRLLLTGQMSGSTAVTARRMITASDDAAANALYLRAGGDAVLPLVAAHYGIPDLGTPPPIPGRWGLTRLTARGLVHLYAAIARDPAVHPWLSDAMTHATAVAADGTAQFFGLPAATAGAAIKQGWGHDGSGNAVVNSTGYVQDGRFAVAILTAGPPGTYGAPLEATVSDQARALLPGGRPTDVTAPRPAAGAPGGRVASVAGGAGVITVTGTEFDPALPAGAAPSLTVSVDGRPGVVASAGPQRPPPGSATGALPFSAYSVRVAAAAGTHTVHVTYTGATGRQTVEGTWSVTVQPTAAQARHELSARLRVAVLIALGLLGAAGCVAAAVIAGRRLRELLGRRREERRARAARLRLARAARAGGPGTRLVRLPYGQLVRVRARPHPARSRTAPPVRPAGTGATARPRSAPSRVAAPAWPGGYRAVAG